MNTLSQGSMIYPKLLFRIMILSIIINAEIGYTQINNDHEIIATLKKDISFLASDSLMGRESGTIYERMAADYIIQRFQECGLNPLPGMDSWEHVFIYYNDFEVKKTDMQPDTFVNSAGYLYPIRYSASGKASGRFQAINPYDSMPSDLSGKIAAFRPWHQNDSARLDRGLVPDLYLTLREVESRGAEAVVLYSYPGEPIDYNHWMCPGNDTLSIPVFFLNYATYPGFFNSWKQEFDFSVWVSRMRPDTAMNIVGYLNRNAEKTVVIGAHYDHIGMGYFGSRSEFLPDIHNGADDNASGVATIIELARFLSSCDSLRHNYLFVAFGAEEKGLIGSRFFSGSQAFNDLDIHYMINFDMVGRMKKLRDKTIVMGTGTSKLFEPMLLDYPYKGRLCLFSSAWEGSDHVWFEQRKIPFLYFTTGLHSDYHKFSDDTRKINFKGMVRVLELSEYMILRLDKIADINYDVPEKVNMIRYLSVFLP
ncbi:MAG: M28 family peptidase [Bacteroidetes bacterium]|nr:M28 family peptidase [Bacteroidota bacterium]